MSTVSERLEAVENKVSQIEVDSARLDERLAALVASTNNLKWGIYAITLICVLALVYGAIGRDGLFAVRDVAGVSTHSNITNGGSK